MNGKFNSDVDNPLRLPHVHDVIFGPCIDSNGRLRGLVQLFHKKKGEAGSEQDMAELNYFLPKAAELIKKADELRTANELIRDIKARI